MNSPKEATTLIIRRDVKKKVDKNKPKSEDLSALEPKCNV